MGEKRSKDDPRDRRRQRREARRAKQHHDKEFKRSQREQRRRARAMLKTYGRQAYNMCASKRAYESRSEAEYKAFVRSTDIIKFRAYPCKYCGKWHITHKAPDDYKPTDKSHQVIV